MYPSQAYSYTVFYTSGSDFLETSSVYLEIFRSAQLQQASPVPHSRTHRLLKLRATEVAPQKLSNLIC
jgi:hypothetical protein